MEPQTSEKESKPQHKTWLSEEAKEDELKHVKTLKGTERQDIRLKTYDKT